MLANPPIGMIRYLNPAVVINPPPPLANDRAFMDSENYLFMDSEQFDYMNN